MKTAADLKGGVVGVSSFGSESDATVTLALQRLGLTRDDITLKEYGGGTRRLAALKAGEIKATAINEPVASTAREQGLNMMVDLVAEKIPWLFSRRGDQAKLLDAIAGLLARLLKADRSRATTWRSRTRRAPRRCWRGRRRSPTAKIIDISYEDFRQQTPRQHGAVGKGAENIIAQYPGGVSRNVEDYVDTGILERLRQEGFLAPACSRNTGAAASCRDRIWHGPSRLSPGDPAWPQDQLPAGIAALPRAVASRSSTGPADHHAGRRRRRRRL